MEFLLPLIIGLVVGAGLGALAVLLLKARAAEPAAAAENPEVVRAQHQLALTEQQAAADRALAEQQAAASRALAAQQSEADRAVGEVREQLASALAQADGLREQVETLVARQRELAEQQRADQAERRQQVEAEHKVLQALAPVSKTIGEMKDRVAVLEQQRTLQHGELTQQLKTAVESEERLRATAESLASALRSNSTRGVWGETQLRSVVEAAGLIERVDFDTQANITAESGARRPDMVVHLPGGKNIAVDAKVPFNSYLEASAIPATAAGAEGARRAELLKEHVKAVRDHITTLGTKGYWSGLDNAPEMTIAFIPSESLISSALETDPGLLEFAFGKRVALASPVTLWSVLKTVAFSWQQDVLTNEAKTLFDLSRELYTRLSKTAEHIDRLGRAITSTVKNYNGFVGSLERQVLPTARKIGALNEEKLFAIAEPIEEPARELAAPELVAALEESEGEASSMHGIASE
ncbi:MAG: DNA recombination protein RmuC [Microbacteriaceae bacterium]|nr:DNA recombination protein RmuC [Microbacteriaceae bacterium]MCL2794061.1 DNA recombination protein RmuC [Microbacteriaceae bacterium]